MATLNEIANYYKKIKKEYIRIKKSRIVFYDRIECYHADEDCRCPCGKHAAASHNEYLTRPESCRCRDYHKPPKTPCGCFRADEMKFDNDLTHPPIIQEFEGFEEPEMFRFVPGLFTFEYSRGKQKFKVFKRGDEIIESCEETEEINGRNP